MQTSADEQIIYEFLAQASFLITRIRREGPEADFSVCLLPEQSCFNAHGSWQMPWPRIREESGSFLAIAAELFASILPKPPEDCGVWMGVGRRKRAAGPPRDRRSVNFETTERNAADSEDTEGWQDSWCSPHLFLTICQENPPGTRDGARRANSMDMAKDGPPNERNQSVRHIKWLWMVVASATLGSSGFAQVPAPVSAAPSNVPAANMPGIAPMPNQAGAVPVNAAPFPVDGAPIINLNDSPEPDRFKGNQNFQNFIGFISNPLQSIDPRAVTELWPLFASYHTSSVPALPSADMQLYGAGINVALGERFSFGLNQGGYAQANFSRNQPALFPNLAGLIQNRLGYGGLREGWLDIGGWAQYTIIQNVEEQFLLTAGMRWESPSGAQQLFQGNPPWSLAPYLTAGKEFGKFHVLANVGYDFAAGSGQSTLDNFYVNLHFDRQCFGWFYPLVEINSSFPTSNTAVGLPTRFGYINLGDFSSTGNIVMLAAGANAVIVPNKMEFGAVYTTSIATERNFNVSGLIVRATFRY